MRLTIPRIKRKKLSCAYQVRMKDGTSSLRFITRRAVEARQFSHFVPTVVLIVNRDTPGMIELSLSSASLSLSSLADALTFPVSWTYAEIRARFSDKRSIPSRPYCSQAKWRALLPLRSVSFGSAPSESGIVAVSSFRTYYISGVGLSVFLRDGLALCSHKKGRVPETVNLLWSTEWF